VVLLRVLRLFSSLALAVIVVFAIVAPLASVLQASGVDGRVYVVVPRAFVGWLEGQGYSLGSLFIAMMSPLDYKGYSYWLRDVVGDRLPLDFRRIAKSWEEFYKNNPEVLEAPPLPAVSITITLYKDEGDRVLECTAHYTYSTIDYFIEKGLKLDQAVERARADPLAHLRKPLVITLNPRMPKSEIKVSCADLSPIVEDLRRAMGGDVRISGESSLDTMVAQDGLTQQSTCPANFTEVWWYDLYDSRNSPPSGWMSNVIYYDGSPVPDSLKLRVWSAYARNWSLAYYFRESQYTLGEAMLRTLRELSFRPPFSIYGGNLYQQRLYTMDEWVDIAFRNVLREGHTPPSFYSWRDYHERNPSAPREWSGSHPFLGVYLHNPNNKPIYVVGSFVITKDRYYKHGIGIAGFIFVGSESATSTATNILLTVLQHRGKMYAAVHATYRYNGDGMLVRLDATRTWPISGCGSYWRITVVTPTIVPIKSSTLYPNMWTRLFEDPRLLPNLTYGKYEEIVFFARLINTPSNSIVYRNSSFDVANLVSNPNLASLATNILLNALFYAAEDIGCPLITQNPNPRFCRLFVKIASELVDHVYEDLQAIGLSYTVEVWTSGYVSDASVWVRKTTLVYIDRAYLDIRYRPLMVLFNVSVW
jgi:hypothetical protein